MDHKSFTQFSLLRFIIQFGVFAPPALCPAHHSVSARIDFPQRVRARSGTGPGEVQTPAESNAFLMVFYAFTQGRELNRTLPPSDQIWAVPPKLHIFTCVWQVEKIIERSQSFKNFPSSSKRNESRLYSPLIRNYTVFFALYLVIQKTTYRTRKDTI